jgi:SOS response regulatory protein OraA/RecX
MALDRLESEGLLSDLRYAETWMRQRIRRHPEGPRSLAAALAARGVSRDASREALAAVFDESSRFGLLTDAAAMLGQKLKDPSSSGQPWLNWAGVRLKFPSIYCHVQARLDIPSPFLQNT